jgi:beta-lactamase class A
VTLVSREWAAQARRGNDARYTEPKFATMKSLTISLLALGIIYSACGAGEKSHPLTPERLAYLDKALGDYERRVEGEVGVAVAPLHTGSVRTFGPLQRGRAWSALKVPVVVAFLNGRRETEGARNGVDTLSKEDRALVEQAIRRSDNYAAAALYGRLGQADERRASLQATLRASGDRSTIVASPNFGATAWELEDGVNFYRELARNCLLTRPDTEFLLGLMRQIARVDWGVAKAYPASVPVASKSGWGPNQNLRWLMEQFAIVGEGTGAYVLAIMARPSLRSASREDPASFRAGAQIVNEVALLVRRELERPSVGPERGLPIPALRRNASTGSPSRQAAQPEPPRNRRPC